MADADTNKTTAAMTTTTPAGVHGGGGGTASAGLSATVSQASEDAETRTAAARVQTGAAKKEEPKLFVDGLAVDMDVYLKAAEEAGWDPALLQERKFFPAVVSKKK